MQAAADEVNTMHPFIFLSICMPIRQSHRSPVLLCHSQQLRQKLLVIEQARRSRDCQHGHSRLYQLGKKMMCNSHSTGAVALNVLQVLLERPATKSRCHPPMRLVPSRSTLSCIPSFKKAGQDVASVVEDQLNVNILCGFSNGFKVAAGLTEVHSNLCSHH